MSFFFAFTIVNAKYFLLFLLKDLFWDYVFQFIEREDVSISFVNYDTQQEFSWLV